MKNGTNGAPAPRAAAAAAPAAPVGSGTGAGAALLPAMRLFTVSIMVFW